jgi:hypothetical protein
MPFSVRELGFGWRHVLLGVNRRLLGKRSDQFIDSWRAQGVTMTALLYDGRPQRCQLCGYLLAELELPNGWHLQSCSSVGFRRFLGNGKATDWAKELVGINLPRGPL